MEQLLALASSNNGQALYLASRMLLQVMEGKCKPRIEEALHGRHLRIVQDHVLLNPYEACDFELELLDPALDCATAREDWICQWTFSHPQESPLTEEGWEVTHYFQKPEVYGLQVVLTHRTTATSRLISDPRYQNDSKHGGEPNSVHNSFKVYLATDFIFQIGFFLQRLVLSPERVSDPHPAFARTASLSFNSAISR